jgi:hypothetical protein
LNSLVQPVNVMAARANMIVIFLIYSKFGCKNTNNPCNDQV